MSKAFIIQLNNSRLKWHIWSWSKVIVLYFYCSDFISLYYLVSCILFCICTVLDQGLQQYFKWNTQNFNDNEKTHSTELYPSYDDHCLLYNLYLLEITFFITSWFRILGVPLLKMIEKLCHKFFIWKVSLCCKLISQHTKEHARQCRNYAVCNSNFTFLVLSTWCPSSKESSGKFILFHVAKSIKFLFYWCFWPW